MATNQGFKSFIPNQNRIEAGYLSYWLRQNRQFLQSLGNGATFKEVSKAVVARVELPVPSISEQRRIAATLDQADALRAKRRAALAQLDEMAEAIFIEMFIPGSLNRSWPEVTIGNLGASIRTGPFGSQLLHSEFVDQGVAVLGIDNAVHNAFTWAERRYITRQKYAELSRYRVHPGDVIITIMGTCGRVAIVPDDIPLAITTKHLCSITLDRTLCHPAYLHAALLMHPAVLQQLGASAKGAIMPGLNMGLIKSTKLPLPPIELQTKFADRQETLRQLRLKMTDAQMCLDALFASLQHRAFRGEL